MERPERMKIIFASKEDGDSFHKAVILLIQFSLSYMTISRLTWNRKAMTLNIQLAKIAENFIFGHRTGIIICVFGSTLSFI